MPATYSGYFGEPYCCTGCKLMGGTDAIQAAASGASGSCHVCSKALQASLYADFGFVIPFENGLFFSCTGCTDRAKAFLAGYEKCCRCGDPIA